MDEQLHRHHIKLHKIIKEKGTTPHAVFMKYMESIDPDLYEEGCQYIIEVISNLKLEQLKEFMTKIKNE